MMYLCPQITKTKQDMEVISIERSTYEEQQIATRNQRQHCHRCIKHKEKYIFPNMIVHNAMALFVKKQVVLHHEHSCS